MKKIEWVRIENFRNFSQLEIEKIGDVNIIVGKNNTGKSTFLEALFLSIEAPSLLRSTLKTILEKRGISFSPRRLFLSDVEINDLKDFLMKVFFYDKRKAWCEIITPFRNFPICLSIFEGSLNELLKDLKKNSLEYLVLSETSTDNFIEQLEISSLARILFIPLKMVPIPLELEEESQNINILLSLNLEKRDITSSEESYKILIDSSLFLSSSPKGGTIWSALIKKFENFLAPDAYLNLKKLLSPFFNTKITTISPSISDLYIETEVEKIPFSLVGDGVKHFSLNYFALNLDRPSYIFLEEPETFLHPKMMKILAEEIIRSGRKNQIFLTTHSLEFVKYLLYYANKETDVDTKVLGFYNLTDGQLDYEIYGKTKAHLIVNRLGEDIR